MNNHFDTLQEAVIEISRLQRQALTGAPRQAEAIERGRVLDTQYAPCYYIPGYDTQGPTENENGSELLTR